MATTKPRITVTLTHRQHELLKAISDATGSSMSAYVSDLLESCEPVLERMATTMQKLRQLNTQRKASVVAALDECFYRELAGDTERECSPMVFDPKEVYGK